MLCRYVIKGHHPPILLSYYADWGDCYPLRQRPRWITASEICIILHIIWKQNSFSGGAYPQAPLVWRTFGTPAFISAQTSSKFHATPLTDLNEFAMNNRYLGHSDWDLIWHVVHRGQIKYFFFWGDGRNGYLWKEPKYDRHQNHTLPIPSHVAVYMGKVLLICVHTEELVVLLLAEILF